MQREYTPEQVARFWTRVERGYGCWLWRGYAGVGRGYGSLTVNNRLHLAHRFAWEVTHGPIPAGLWVCHRCDNPPCVRPDHLFLGRQRDNMDDMMHKGRSPKPKPLAPGRLPRAAKLSEAQVLEIRRLKPRGQAQITLAAELGISPRTIREILSRDTWRHL